MGRIWRVLRLVITLHKAPRAMKQLTELFGVDKRTIYRDLRLIQQAGIKIEKDKDGWQKTRYRVTGL